MSKRTLYKLGGTWEKLLKGLKNIQQGSILKIKYDGRHGKDMSRFYLFLGVDSSKKEMRLLEICPAEPFERKEEVICWSVYFDYSYIEHYSPEDLVEEIYILRNSLLSVSINASVEAEAAKA